MPARLTALILASALAAAVFRPAPGPRDRLLVSPAWLEAHLHDPDLVLLHIGDRAGYEREHLPGARYLPTGALSARPESGLAMELPPVARLDSVLSALGVTGRSRLVLYFGNDWLSPTTRAWLTLNYLGRGGRTVILDGGQPAWKAAGLPVTAEPGAARAGAPDGGFRTSFAQIHHNSRGPAPYRVPTPTSWRPDVRPTEHPAPRCHRDHRTPGGAGRSARSAAGLRELAPAAPR